MHHAGLHDASLVIVSILVAVLASFAALDLATRIPSSSGRLRYAWLGAAAFAMGGGIWSMHFVGMLAFRLPGVEIGYDLELTLISLVLPIAVTAFGFFVASTQPMGATSLTVGGLVMGFGISAMHYTGMAAMRMSASVHHQPLWVVLSIVIAIAASVIALRLAYTHINLPQRLAAAVLMGIAISGMHYSAMHGAVFKYPSVINQEVGVGVGHKQLALWITATTVLTLLLALATAMFDRHLALLAERQADALRQSEARFHVLVDGVTDYAICMLDTRGIVTSWNAGAERITGYRAEEILGKHFGEFFTDDDRTADVPARILDQARTTGRYETEGVRVRKNGSRIHAHVVVNPLKDGRGELIGFAKITRDITERVEAQKRLRLAQEQLAQSQKMESLGQLTGGMAHDFNNMLAIVTSALQLSDRALQRAAYDKAREYIAGGLDGAQRAAELVRRLLAFARQQPLAPKPIDANAHMRNMSEMLRRTLGTHIQLEVVLGGGLWNIRADPSQLESAIVNLATNARDAMPEGGRLTIETSNAHLDDRYAAAHIEVAPGQYVLIAVTDTGTGMTPEQTSKAFEPFFTTKGHGRGTGLGLAQVYGFAKQSGGHARIYSEGGHGTTVKLYLPRYLGDAPQEQIKPEDPAPLGSARETVLLVDDEDRVRRLVADGLQELGYSVLVADSGEAALKILDGEQDIVLLFTDVVMPNMNGRKLAEEALLRRPGLKVLFTTGFTRNAIIHHGTIDANTHFIAKPYTLEDLVHKIREVLGR